MKEIQLTQGMVALVDDDDYEFLMQYKWHAAKNRNAYYARTCQVKNETHKNMHRLILNAKKDDIIDHIDRNGLNNQKGNIRLCTRSENSQNSRANGSSKYLGVSIHNYRTRTMGNRSLIEAKICKYRRIIYLGTFKTEEEAAIAYDKKAIELYGSGARLNFPELIQLGENTFVQNNG